MGIRSGRLHDAVTTAQLSAISEMSLTNLVANGDFSNGTTGWGRYASTCSITAADNTLSVTGTGSQLYAITIQNLSGAADGHEIYIAAKVTVTNSVCVRVLAGMYVSGSAAIAEQVATPVQDSVVSLSGICTTLNNIAEIKLFLRHDYASKETAENKVMEAQYITAIDLTNVFGAGNEPSKEEMDAVMQLYDDEWFNGTTKLNFVDYLLIKIKYLQDQITAI